MNAMLGNAVRIGVLGALALAGSMQVASSLPQCATSDRRMVSLVAQWKIATGDAEGAYEVVRRADVCRQSTIPTPQPTRAHVQAAPTSHRS
jgi:hypothetical protein